MTRRCCSTILVLSSVVLVLSGRASPTFASASAPDVAVAIEPGTASVGTGEQLQFVASVTGTAETPIEWAVREGTAGGRVDAVGLYSAPAQPGTYHLVARGCMHPIHDGIATVTVIARPLRSFIVPERVQGDVVVSIDSRATSPVSRFAFGTNFKYEGDPVLKFPPGFIPRRTPLQRIGGNSLSDYNWETGYTNVGADWHWINTDVYSGKDPRDPGSSFRRFADVAFADDTAFLMTVPLMRYVAADDGRGLPMLNWENPRQRWATSRYQLDYVPDLSRFRRLIPKNPAGATAVPDMDDEFVFVDDFAAWLRANYPGHEFHPSQRIFLCLDNEPDFWGGDDYGMHGEVMGWYTSAQTFPHAPAPPWAPGFTTVRLGHQDHIDRTIATSAAIKDVLPRVEIFGFVGSGFRAMYDLDNRVGHGTYPKHGIPPRYLGATFPYLEMFLDALDQASRTAGRRLVDVLDFHWYAAGGPSRHSSILQNDDAPQTPAMIDARCQDPRTLWDPGFRSHDGRDWKPAPHGLAGQPIQILNRLKAALARYPAGPQKLAITEYHYGRGGDISGCIAHADALGIFAREGVYAATIWPWTKTSAAPYSNDVTKAYAGVAAALRTFVDHDGRGGHFGDTYARTVVHDPRRPLDPNRPVAAPAQTSERITAYASYDAADPHRMVVVVINKTQGHRLQVGFSVTHSSRFSRAEVYRTTGGNGAAATVVGPSRAPDVPATGVNAFQVMLPPQSVTVLALMP